MLALESWWTGNGKKSANSFEKSRFSNFSSPNNEIEFPHQDFNGKLSTCEKPLCWKIVESFPCIRILLVWKLLKSHENWLISFFELMFSGYYSIDFLHHDLNRKLKIWIRGFDWEVIDFYPSITIMILRKSQKVPLIVIHLYFQTHIFPWLLVWFLPW